MLLFRSPAPQDLNPQLPVAPLELRLASSYDQRVHEDVDGNEERSGHEGQDDLLDEGDGREGLPGGARRVGVEERSHEEPSPEGRDEVRDALRPGRPGIELRTKHDTATDTCAALPGTRWANAPW